MMAEPDNAERYRLIHAFEMPSRLHSYTKGLHDTPCLACTLLPEFRALLDETARLREALGATMEHEDDSWHSYDTCWPGGAENTDRGCLACVARAALSNTETTDDS